MVSNKNKRPLIPRYISTVDSGNFVGYLYVVKSFLNNILKEYRESQINIENNKNESNNKITDNNFIEIENLIDIIESLIKNTDFSVLYNNELKYFQ